MIDYTVNMTDVEYMLCILVRISMFVYTAPFFSQRGVPRMMKLAMSLFLTGMMYTVIGDHKPLQYETVYGYAIIVLKEALVGAIVGYSAAICNSIVDFAGRIIDMESGLSMSNLMDPTTGMSGSMTGVMYQYAVTLMLIITGMHRYLITALAQTYILIPVDGAVFNSDKLLASVIKFAGDYIEIGFRICLPVFAVMLLLNAVLGIMAKVAPQMNMFAVGMQLKVLVGICILFFTASLMPTVANFIYTEMKTMIATFVNTMI
ncbi:MAG: flagellar biosynthetic protein FliR [Lachnospiraceae bacterium]|nr:flagellar biosynthetic protein FliR [Lachnospiraceae bacterium]